MRIKDIIREYELPDNNSFEQFIRSSNIPMKQGIGGMAIDDSINVKDLVKFYYIWKDEEDVRREVQYNEIQRAEQQAKADERERRINEANMMLSTCQSIEGYKVTKQLGIVFGEILFKAGALKSISASIDNLGASFALGDQELTGSTKLINDARNYATNKLIEEALNRGANAVIGIDSETAFGTGSILHITIYGTAVYLEKE